MGTYVGNSSVYNTGFQEINLGFKPISLVIIKDYSSERGVIIPLEYKMTIKSFGDNYEQINNIASITSVGGGQIKAYGNSDGGSSTNPPDDQLVLQLTATGFKVANVAGYWKDTSSDIYQDTECMLNDKDVVYTYIALKGE